MNSSTMHPQLWYKLQLYVHNSTAFYYVIITSSNSLLRSK